MSLNHTNSIRMTTAFNNALLSQHISLKKTTQESWSWYLVDGDRMQWLDPALCFLIYGYYKGLKQQTWPQPQSLAIMPFN